MLSFAGNRLIRSVIVLLLISVVTFGFMHAVPGSPFSSRGGRPVPKEIQEQLEEEFGLNKPLVTQYSLWLGNLMRLNLGPSLTQLDYTVNELLFGLDFASAPLRSPAGVSAQIGFYSFALALLVGIPMGALAAVYRNKPADHAAMFISTLGVSVPNFVLGLLLILVFSLTLGWLPVFGWGKPSQAIMPVVTLSTGGMAIIARLTRASLLEILGHDYIRTARSKGLREQVILMRHAMRNALVPVVTVLGPLLAAWLTGTFLVEVVFAIPGIGANYVRAVVSRDYFMILATTMIYSTVLVLANLAVDLVYAAIDPRIRFR